MPHWVRRHSQPEMLHLSSAYTVASHRYNTDRGVRQSLTIMAQIWDNEPAGLVQRSTCFPPFHHLSSSSTETFLPRNRSLSSIDLSAPKVRATLDCTATLWLSNLYQILSRRLEHLENLPEITSNLSKTLSVVSADTTERQQTKTAIQTQQEAPVPFLSIRTGKK